MTKWALFPKSKKKNYMIPIENICESKNYFNEFTFICMSTRTFQGGGEASSEYVSDI